MKVKELIMKLKKCNPNAEIEVVAFNMKKDFSICYGGAEGLTPKTADSFCFYIDELNGSENKGE